MTAGRRLGAYGLMLAGLFGAAYAVGEQLPEHRTDVPAAHTHDGAVDSAANTGDTANTGDMADMAGMDAAPEQLALASVADGYRLIVDEHDDTSIVVHLEHDGRPVTEFVEQHEASLHLLVVRRDLTGFQHLHPTMAADGTWTADADLAEPGAWRVVADTWPADADAGIALGADVLVPGDASVADLPAPATMVGVDGLMFMRDGLHITVSPADDLEPYLGQPAHLVAYREGDLAYTHLHPTSDTPGDLEFAQSLPGPGTYRLFLQVKRSGTVVLAEFTVVVDDDGGLS